MGDTVALRSVAVKLTPPAKTDARPTDPVLDRGPTRVVLTGVAGTDVQVGVLFGRLAEAPLFHDVKLSFSRETQQAGRQMREFELTFTLQRVVAPR